MSLGGADRFTVDEPIYRHSHPSSRGATGTMHRS